MNKKCRTLPYTKYHTSTLSNNANNSENINFTTADDDKALNQVKNCDICVSSTLTFFYMYNNRPDYVHLLVNYDYGQMENTCFKGYVYIYDNDLMCRRTRTHSTNLLNLSLQMWFSFIILSLFYIYLLIKMLFPVVSVCMSEVCRLKGKDM